MINHITLEFVLAYSKCLRKAFLNLWPESQGTPHEYMRLLEEQACRSRHEYLQRIEHKYPGATTGDVTKFLTGEQILLSVELKAHDLVAIAN